MRSLSVIVCCAALSVLLLTACVNDGASYKTDGGRQLVSVVRENSFFWEKRAKFSVIIARVPDCQRRHSLQSAVPKTHVELWQPGDNTFVLRMAGNMYLVENRTCEGFSELNEDPPGGLGRHLGTFGESKGEFVFAPQEPEPEPAAAR